MLAHPLHPQQLWMILSTKALKGILWVSLGNGDRWSLGTQPVSITWHSIRVSGWSRMVKKLKMLTH